MKKQEKINTAAAAIIDYIFTKDKNTLKIAHDIISENPGLINEITEEVYINAQDVDVCEIDMAMHLAEYFDFDKIWETLK